jgi:hypothetical protein
MHWSHSVRSQFYCKKWAEFSAFNNIILCFFFPSMRTEPLHNGLGFHKICILRKIKRYHKQKQAFRKITFISYLLAPGQEQLETLGRINPRDWLRGPKCQKGAGCSLCFSLKDICQLESNTDKWKSWGQLLPSWEDWREIKMNWESTKEDRPSFPLGPKTCYLPGPGEAGSGPVLIVTLAQHWSIFIHGYIKVICLCTVCRKEKYHRETKILFKNLHNQYLVFSKKILKYNRK